VRRYSKNHRWQEVYDKGALSPIVSMVRGRQCWERLLRAVPVENDWIGLDFGCGQAHLLQLMASRMRMVFGFDSGPNQIRIAERNTSGMPNVIIRQHPAPPPSFHSPRFDLIVVNSVVELMNDEELDQWLKWWIGSLSERGALVISDIMPGRNDRLKSFIESLQWGFREGCLLGYFHEYILMMKSGFFREQAFCRDSEELLLWINRSGGRGRLMRRNVDFLTTRYAVIAAKDIRSPAR